MYLSFHDWYIDFYHPGYEVNKCNTGYSFCSVFCIRIFYYRSGHCSYIRQLCYEYISED